MQLYAKTTPYATRSLILDEKRQKVNPWKKIQIEWAVHVQFDYQNWNKIAFINGSTEFWRNFIPLQTTNFCK